MAKECSECGNELTFKDSFVYNKKSVCKACLKKLESSETEEKPKRVTLKTKFRALAVYEGILYFLGWIGLIGGILVFIIGLVTNESSPTLFGLYGVIGGFVTLVSSQVIGCFISVEKHIRATYELLKNKIEMSS